MLAPGQAPGLPFLLVQYSPPTAGLESVWAELSLLARSSSVKMAPGRRW
jgi:hypothetical protein